MAKETELHTNTQKPQNCKNKRKICAKLINCVETLLSLRFLSNMSLKQNVRNKKVLVSYKTELHTSTQKPQNFKNKRKICVKLINCVETLCFFTFFK